MAEGVAEEITGLIQEQGKITFARFMEVALFSPRGGYYTGQTGGVGRDFYTAPGAHPAFGALVALQMEQMWSLMGSPSPFYVVEIGAGSGTLARDALAYASGLPSGFRQALEYVAVDYEPSFPSPGNVHRVRAGGLPFRDVVGCVLSNELLDSFPVHRFTVQEGRIREVYVTLRSGELVDALDEPSTALIEERLLGLGMELPEGFQGEVNLALEEWTAELSRALRRGFVLTFDYGHLAPALYSPERRRGTLRCYYSHTLVSNPYRHLGRQDITAHVDFTSLMRLGEEHGLVTVGFASQREFLQNLGFTSLFDSLRRRQLPQRERNANRMAMLDLVKPGEMGDFKVLAQARGMEQNIHLSGFTQGSPLREGTQAGRDLPEAPLLSPGHMDLMGGRYPHLSWESEGLGPFEQES